VSKGTDAPRVREELPTLLQRGSRGVELGVAKGHYARQLLNSEKFDELWLVDRWADHHDLLEYHYVVRTMPQARVLRETFKAAADLFEDASFDFVYVDGYAHTGQEGGHTLDQWWPKVCPGGIFAGHDYCPKHWRPTVDAVDRFVERHWLTLNVTSEARYPSWWVRKPW